MKGDGFSWPGCLVSSCGRTSQANPHPREGVCLLLPAQVPKPFGEAAEEAQGWVGWSWFRPTLRGGGKEHRCSSILLPCKERAALPVTPLPPFTPLSCSLPGYLPWAHSPSCIEGKVRPGRVLPGRVLLHSGLSAGLAVLLGSNLGCGRRQQQGGAGGSVRECLPLGVGAGVVCACLCECGELGGRLLHLHRYVLLRERGREGETRRGRGRVGERKKKRGGERWTQED